MSSTSKISILLLNYNSQKYIDRCVKSLEAQSFKDWELVLIDNGSTDGSGKYFKEKYLSKNFPRYLMIASPTNLGFARANNIASMASNGEYIFILNCDTWLEQDCLEKLWQASQKTEGVFAPCQLAYDSDRFISCGVGTDIFGYPYTITKKQYDNGQKPFYADGAAIFIKKELFNVLGQFDDSTFLFHEDIDLSWKARLLNYNVIQVKEAIVHHVSGGTIEGGAIKYKGQYTTNHFRRYLGERNNIRNLLKNYSWPILLWILPLYLLINIAEILVFTILLKPRVIWCYLKAWIWNIIFLQDTLSRRLMIQPYRKVADRQIMNSMYRGSAKLATFLQVGIPKFR